MPWKLRKTLRRSTAIGVALAASLLLGVPSSNARVTRIIIDTTTASTPSADNVAYQTLVGRAFGELDPNDAHNQLITDIGIAPKNANGKVEYIASFTITTPTDLSRASGFVWHDVPNRGGRSP